MRKKLSLFQTILLVVISILPHVNGMFTWNAHSLFEGYNYKTSKSLDNLITEPMVGVDVVVYWLFYIVLVAMVVYCLVELFSDSARLLMQRKVWIYLPISAFLLGMIILFSVANYRYSYTTKTGYTRYESVSMELLGWIELLLLLSVVITEFYKQYRCGEKKQDIQENIT